MTQGIYGNVLSATRARHWAILQLARNTEGGTSIATVTISTDAATCVFAAQAVVQPG
jgi:hypothetical protein